jgi:hypothetical protein
MQWFFWMIVLQLIFFFFSPQKQSQQQNLPNPFTVATAAQAGCLWIIYCEVCEEGFANGLQGKERGKNRFFFSRWK